MFYYEREGNQIRDKQMVRLRGRTGNRYAIYVAGAEPRQRKRVDNGYHHAHALRSVRRGGETCHHRGHVQVEEPAVVARGSCHRSSSDACGLIPSIPGRDSYALPYHLT